jgi:hypothetical protein
LLIVAIALFGFDSFISARSDHPEYFIHDYRNSSHAIKAANWAEYTEACVDQKPLSSLLGGFDGGSSFNCAIGSLQNRRDLDVELAEYVRSFYLFGENQAQDGKFGGEMRQNAERSENAFASAVFLANEAWLTSDVSHASRWVTSDPGADMVVPAISRQSMILISTLWAVYIACLVSIAVYSARTPRWTNQLDAFAMMRLGAVMTDQINLDVGFETKAIGALDEMSGIIGDATGGEGEIGVLGVGASTPLRGARQYRCYKGDEEEALRRAPRKRTADKHRARL